MREEKILKQSKRYAAATICTAVPSPLQCAAAAEPAVASCANCTGDPAPIAHLTKSAEMSPPLLYRPSTCAGRHADGRRGKRGLGRTEERHSMASATRETYKRRR
jgi:hypothetical protein